MENIKKAGEFLGNLVLGTVSVIFVIACGVVLGGLYLRLIHFALGGYTIWMS